MSDSNDKNRKKPNKNRNRKPKNFRYELTIELVQGILMVLGRDEPRVEFKDGNDWKVVPEELEEAFLAKRIRNSEIRERAIATWRNRKVLVDMLGANLRKAGRPRTDEGDRNASDKKPTGKPKAEAKPPRKKEGEAAQRNKRPEPAPKPQNTGGAKVGDVFSEQLKNVKVASAVSPEETAEEISARVVDAAFGSSSEKEEPVETPAPAKPATAPTKAKAVEGVFSAKQLRMYVDQLRRNGGDVDAIGLSPEAREQVLAAAKEAKIELKPAAKENTTSPAEVPASEGTKALH